MLGLKSCHFVFCFPFVVFLLFVFFFLPSVGYLNIFLNSILSIVFLTLSLYTAFLAVVLHILDVLHILLQLTGVNILSVSVKCRNLTSLYIPSCSSIYNRIVLTVSSTYIENIKQCYSFCFNHQM